MSVGMEPPYGWGGPEPIEFFVSNRTGATLAIGDVSVLDLLNTEAEVTSNDVGKEASGFANTRIIAAGQGAKNGIVVVALESIVDGGYGKVCARGVVKVAVGTSLFGTTASAVKGTKAYANTGKVFLDILATPAVVGARAQAIILANTATFTANNQNELNLCLFDGTGGNIYYAS